MDARAMAGLAVVMEQHKAQLDEIDRLRRELAAAHEQIATHVDDIKGLGRQLTAARADIEGLTRERADAIDHACDCERENQRYERELAAAREALKESLAQARINGERHAQALASEAVLRVVLETLRDAAHTVERLVGEPAWCVAMSEAIGLADAALAASPAEALEVVQALVEQVRATVDCTPPSQQAGGQTLIDALREVERWFGGEAS